MSNRVVITIDLPEGVVPDMQYQTRQAPTPTAVPPPAVGANCPVHQTPFSYQQPGVSKKTGKPYKGFWKCDEKDDDGDYCQQKPSALQSPPFAGPPVKPPADTTAAYSVADDFDLLPF